MIEAAKRRALPVLSRAVDVTPAAQACCGACRACWTTNLAAGAAALAVAASAPIVRLGSRVAARRRWGRRSGLDVNPAP